MSDWREVERARGEVLSEIKARKKGMAPGSGPAEGAGPSPEPSDAAGSAKGARRDARQESQAYAGKIVALLGCGGVVYSLFGVLLFKDALFASLMILMVSSLLTFLGIGIFFSSSKEVATERVHLNGFTVPNGVGGTVFVPWGRVLSYAEFDLDKGPYPEWLAWSPESLSGLSERGVALYGRGYSKHTLTSEIDNYDRVIGLVRERSGRAEHDSSEFHRTMVPTVGLNVLMCLLISVFAGFMFSFFVVIAFPKLTGNGWGGVVIFGPLLALFTFTVIILFQTTTLWGMPRGIVSHALLSGALVLLLLLSIGPMAGVNWEGLAREIVIDDTRYNVGTALAPGEYDGLVRTIDGPVIVGYGEVLTIRDSVVTFDEGYYNFVIVVYEGGCLNIENTTLSVKDPDGLFSIEVRGTMRMDRCFVERLDYHIFDYDELDMSGGLELKSDDAVVANTTFMMSRGWSILVDRCSPTVRNCTFLDGILQAIRVVEGAPTIEGCTFDDDDDGVYMYGASPLINDCTFKGTGRGIVCQRSDATVQCCTFDEGVGHPIVLDLYSSVDAVDNMVLAGQDLVVTERRWPSEEQPLVMQGRDSMPWVAVSLVAVCAVALHARFLYMQLTRGRPVKSRVKMTQVLEDGPEEPPDMPSGEGPGA